MKKIFINDKKTIEVDGVKTVGSVMDFVENSLDHISVNKKIKMNALLMTEEMTSVLVDNATEGSSLRVQVKKILGDAIVVLSCPGEKVELEEAPVPGDYDDDEETYAAVRALLLKSREDSLKYSHKNGKNYVQIKTTQNGVSALLVTTIAIVLGLIMGLLLKLVMPEFITTPLLNYILNPFKTMFMNAIKIVIGPVVFFSMVSCMGQFKNLAELGRVAAKVMAVYITTTIIAICLALVSSYVYTPGEFGSVLNYVVGTAEGVEGANVSLLDMLVGIVPNNFVNPFCEANTLQIMFLAVLTGLALGTIGKYASVLGEFFEACNSLFLSMTSLIAKFIPLVVFVSVSIMFVEMDISMIGVLAGYMISMVGTILIMMLVYGLLVMIIARLNPISFYRNAWEGILTSFSLSSSSASIPTNLKVCKDNMGISPKICNFSIPLGATVNMDGACITMVVSALFLAKMYGIDVPAASLVPFALTVMMLSVASPGVPGAGIINVGIVLMFVGVPVDAISLILPVFAFIDMFITANNTTGDVTAALIVARSEKMIDLDVYNTFNKD